MSCEVNIVIQVLAAIGIAFVWIALIRLGFEIWHKSK